MITHYEVGRMIGRGGMATVHELHRHGQYKLAEPLAGKKLRIELRDDLDIVRTMPARRISPPSRLTAAQICSLWGLFSTSCSPGRCHFEVSPARWATDLRPCARGLHR